MQYSITIWPYKIHRAHLPLLLKEWAPKSLGFTFFFLPMWGPKAEILGFLDFSVNEPDPVSIRIYAHGQWSRVKDLVLQRVSAWTLKLCLLCNLIDYNHADLNTYFLFPLQLEIKFTIHLCIWYLLHVLVEVCDVASRQILCDYQLGWMCLSLMRNQQQETSWPQ